MQAYSCRAECYDIYDVDKLILRQHATQYIALKLTTSVIDLHKVTRRFTKLNTFETAGGNLSLNRPCVFPQSTTMVRFSNTDVNSVLNLFKYINMPNRAAHLSILRPGQNFSLNILQQMTQLFPANLELSGMIESDQPETLTLYIIQTRFDKILINMDNECLKCGVAKWMVASLVIESLTMTCFQPIFHKTLDLRKFCSSYPPDVPQCEETSERHFTCPGSSSFYNIFLDFRRKRRSIAIVKQLDATNSFQQGAPFEIDVVAARFAELESFILTTEHIRIRDDDVTFPKHIKHIKLRDCSMDTSEIETILRLAVDTGNVKTIQIENHRAFFTFAFLKHLPDLPYTIIITGSEKFNPYSFNNDIGIITLLKTHTITIENQLSLKCNCTIGSTLLTVIDVNINFKMKCLDITTEKVVLFNRDICKATKPLASARKNSYIAWIIPLIILLMLLLFALLYMFFFRSKSIKPKFIRKDDAEDSTLFGTALSLVFPSGGPEE
ncbi:hypothetical protein GJ496_010058 [Pomphorhynchus laevis]|nr:hypothetical protein GJ496_010058 [Pomphorhynchus laevis]